MAAAGRKRGAAKAGLTGDDRRDKVLGDLTRSVTLLGRAIDGVLGGLPDCHVGLIGHGMALVLSGGAKACPTSSFSKLRIQMPVLEPGVVVVKTDPGSAVSMKWGEIKTEPPSVKSAQGGAVKIGRGASGGEPAPTASPSRVCSSEESPQAATDDASSEISEEDSAASTSRSSSSSSKLSSSPAAAEAAAAAASSSTPTQPPPPTTSLFNVFLEWYAAGPGFTAG